MTSETHPGHDFLGGIRREPRRGARRRILEGRRLPDVGRCESNPPRLDPDRRLDWCEDLVFSADSRVLVTVRPRYESPGLVGGRSAQPQSGPRFPADLAPDPGRPGRPVRGPAPPCGRPLGRHHLPVALLPRGRRSLIGLRRAGPPGRRSPQIAGSSCPGGRAFAEGRCGRLAFTTRRPARWSGPKLEPGGIVVDAAFSPDGDRVAIAALTSQTPAERRPADLPGRR